MLRALLGLAMVAALAGCQSGYSKFYIDEIGGAKALLAPPSETEELRIFETSGDWHLDRDNAFVDGYILIGSASFTAAGVGRDQLANQAEEVGASVVFRGSEYSSTRSYVAPYTTTQAVTTYHSGSVYGGGGSGSYSGYSTSYVPQTTYVPRTVTRYRYRALFFAKMRPSCLGMLPYEPDEATRRQLQVPPSLMIATIRNGSPLAEAGAIEGDIFLRFNDRPVGTMRDLFPIPSNQDVEMIVFRDGFEVPLLVRTGDCSGPHYLYAGI